MIWDMVSTRLEMGCVDTNAIVYERIGESPSPLPSPLLTPSLRVGVHPGSRVLGLRKVRAMLTSMLTHLTDPVRGCNWPSERIFWFGFSMGAHVAVDIALHYMPPSLPSSSSPSSASPASASASQSSSDGDTDAKMKDLADRVKHDMKLQQEEKKHHDDTTASAHMNNDHTPQMGENTNINHLAGDSGEDSSTAGMLGQHARVFGGVIAVSSSVMEEYVLNNSEATTRGGSHTRNSNFSNAAGIIGHVSGSSVLERGNLRGTPLLITHGRKDRTMNLQSAMQNIEYLRSLHNNDIGGNSGKTGDSDGSGINNNGESHNNKKKTNARTKTKTKKNRRTNQKNQIKRNGRPSSTPSPPSSPFPSSSPSASSASPSSASSQIYELIDVKVYDKGHSMVSSKEEARDIHIFLSKHMALRSLAMENDPDIIQVV